MRKRRSPAGRSSKATGASSAMMLLQPGGPSGRAHHALRGVSHPKTQRASRRRDERRTRGSTRLPSTGALAERAHKSRLQSPVTRAVSPRVRPRAPGWYRWPSRLRGSQLFAGAIAPSRYPVLCQSLLGLDVSPSTLDLERGRSRADACIDDNARRDGRLPHAANHPDVGAPAAASCGRRWWAVLDSNQ